MTRGASYFRLSSTDDKPGHSLCLEGVGSWCFYNRAKAAGTTPPSHQNKNLYLKVTSQERLGSYLLGRIQNPNESLKSKVWIKCSKIKLAGLHREWFWGYVTILEHDYGYVRGSTMRS